jgi:subfamily B ATP-binding cassette protein MsbA
MKNSSFWRLMGYLRNYRLNVVLSVLSNVLMALFTVASIPLLIPFLQVLFQTDIKTEVQPEWKLDATHIQAWLNYELSQLVLIRGKEGALIIICTIIPLIFFFKNLFAYLALFFMAPARNGIVRDVRTQLFDKLLQLPLGYFTEERKGDLMSRITSDVQEIEWSILNVLETVFREPIILLLSLGAMLAISPTLTGFVLILILFLRLMIIGRND